MKILHRITIAVTVLAIAAHLLKLDGSSTIALPCLFFSLLLMILNRRHFQ